jgi:hypothetical protein
MYTQLSIAITLNKVIPYLPRPLKEFAVGLSADSTARSALYQSKGAFERMVMCVFAKIVTMSYGRMIGPTIARTIVAASVACFAVAAQKICFNTKPYSYVVLPLASVISLPAGLLVGGTIALYKSAQKVVGLFKQETLYDAIKTVCFGLGYASVGLVALKYHDEFPIGLFERTFIPVLSTKLIEKWSGSVLNPVADSHSLLNIFLKKIVHRTS